ncbi:hypothetical protein CDL15_Pgr022109 [Punica granatum]|nr:hypothetical protein CDL15_Pgr022109 [Punica granatum]
MVYALGARRVRAQSQGLVAKLPADLTEIECSATTTEVYKSSQRLGFKLKRVEWLTVCRSDDYSTPRIWPLRFYPMSVCDLLTIRMERFRSRFEGWLITAQGGL